MCLCSLSFKNASEEAKRDRNIAGTHEAVRRELVAKNPSGTRGRRGGHLAEEEESRKEAGPNKKQRKEVPELEQEEPRRSDPLPESIFSRKSIDFPGKAHFYHIPRDLRLEA